MDIIQWIGFFISVMALFFLLTRNLKEVRQQQANPEEYQKKQRAKEMQLKKMLKTLDIDVEEEKILQPVIKKPVIVTPKSYGMEPIRKPQKEAAIIQPVKPSRGKKLIAKIQSPKEMIVLREMIGPPKSLKPVPFHEYWG